MFFYLSIFYAFPAHRSHAYLLLYLLMFAALSMPFSHQDSDLQSCVLSKLCPYLWASNVRNVVFNCV